MRDTDTRREYLARKGCFPRGENIEVILRANQLVSYLKVWMNSNNHGLKDYVYYLLELKGFLINCTIITYNPTLM